MKQIVNTLPLILLSILVLYGICGRLAFGHGLGDIFYYFLLYLTFITYAVYYFYALKHKASFLAMPLVYLIFIFLIGLKMTIWRGVEYSWNGDIITPSTQTIEKRKVTRIQKELKSIENELKINPNNYELILKKGRFLRGNSKYKLALIEFKKAQKLNPKKHQAYWEAGYVYSLIGNYLMVIQQYELAYKRDTTNKKLKEQLDFLKEKYKNVE